MVVSRPPLRGTHRLWRGRSPVVFPNPGESMSGRVVITGASGALGRSVVERFLVAGDRVLAVGATPAGLVELEPLGSAEALSLRSADLSSTPEVERLFDEEEAGAGVPRAVVHLVGGFRWARFAELRDADWAFLLQLHTHTTLRA